MYSISYEPSLLMMMVNILSELSVFYTFKCRLTEPRGANPNCVQAQNTVLTALMPQLDCSVATTGIVYSMGLENLETSEKVRTTEVDHLCRTGVYTTTIGPRSLKDRRRTEAEQTMTGVRRSDWN